MSKPLFRNFVNIIKIIRTQLGLISLISILYLSTRVGLLPPISNIVQWLTQVFNQYGIVAIAICAFIENLGGLNVYFPGSIVILSGMALTSGDPIRAFVTWIAIVIPSFVAHQINFMIGLYSSSLLNEQKIPKAENTKKNWVRLFITCLSTFWHPHFASITSIALGKEKTRYIDFVICSSISCLIWYSFWGLFLYQIGSSFPSDTNLMPLFIFYIFLWISWDLIKHFQKKK